MKTFDDATTPASGSLDIHHSLNYTRSSTLNATGFEGPLNKLNTSATNDCDLVGAAGLEPATLSLEG